MQTRECSSPRFARLALILFLASCLSGCLTPSRLPPELPISLRQELNSQLTADERAVVASCPYFNFVVEYENPMLEKEKFNPGWQRADVDRRRFLEASRQTLTAFGYHIVPDASDASFTLVANGGDVIGQVGQLFASVSFAPRPKLQHHIFIAAMNDESFPFVVSVGASRTSMWSGWYAEDFLWESAKVLAELSWSESSRTLLALCETRANLIDEGVTLEELRQELVAEIQRFRQQRERGRQGKQLELEVDEAREP